MQKKKNTKRKELQMFGLLLILAGLAFLFPQFIGLSLIAMGITAITLSAISKSKELE